METNAAIRVNLERLIYCINAEPRLFRWNNGAIEWSNPPKLFRKPKWNVLTLEYPKDER